jgi:large subunit ribosomal protein L3
VVKGLHMAGHMGDARITVRNLRVIESDPAKGLLFLEGAVPGGKNGLLRIRLSPKTSRARAKAQDKAE